MVTRKSFCRAVGSITGGIAVALVLGWAEMAAAADADHVIQLAQTGCQFLEPEKGVDRGFEPTSADDCNRINAETGDQRLANAEILELSPGTYTFRVTNTDVPYGLGFRLREADYQLGNPLHKLTKASVSGGGLSLRAAHRRTCRCGARTPERALENGSGGRDGDCSPRAAQIPACAADAPGSHLGS